MFISDSFNVNSKGELTIGGVSAVALADKYGTPLIVYDEDALRRRCREYTASLKENYEGKGLVLYASKAFSCLEMCRLCASEGLGLDVVSGGELFTAKAAGFPSERIFFHGNNKSLEELSFAIDENIGAVIVDNLPELYALDSLAGEKGRRMNVMLRVKPGIDAHTHGFIRTGQIDSKFGFALETGEAERASKAALDSENLKLVGLHCHIGSQIFDTEPFTLAAEVMCGFSARLRDKYGARLPLLNLGGGFGIRYLKEDSPLPGAEYVKRIAERLKKCCKELDMPLPELMIEPGRSIAGPSAATVYTVGSIKEIPDIRTYVSVDGGMTDNPRYILYGSKYEMLCADRAAEEKTELVTVAGRCCESGDLLGEKVPLSKLRPKDRLAVLSTGAYNYSMASNYNRVGRPCVVMVSGGKSRIIIKRESYEDMIINDV